MTTKEKDELREAESFILATVKWINGQAHVKVSMGGAKHGWAYCIDEINSLDK